MVPVAVGIDVDVSVQVNLLDVGQSGLTGLQSLVVQQNVDVAQNTFDLLLENIVTGSDAVHHVPGHVLGQDLVGSQSGVGQEAFRDGLLNLLLSHVTLSGSSLEVPVDNIIVGTGNATGSVLVQSGGDCEGQPYPSIVLAGVGNGGLLLDLHARDQSGILLEFFLQIDGDITDGKDVDLTVSVCQVSQGSANRNGRNQGNQQHNCDYLLHFVSPFVNLCNGFIPVTSFLAQ